MMSILVVDITAIGSVKLLIAPDGRFWPYSRRIAYKEVKRVIAEAGVAELFANSRIFRHSDNGP